MTPLKDFHDPASLTDFLAKVGVDPVTGLSRDDAMARRSMYGVNRVTPPVNCPSWVCCLLPCLLRTPSMQAYQRVVPHEATVRRAQGASGKPGRRLRMDATSLVYGDVVEIKAGEAVGADVRVIECSDDCVVDQSTLVGGNDDDEEEEEDVESGQFSTLRRRKKVSTEASDRSDPLASANVLLMTTTLIRGSAVGVVIATGDATVWGQMLAQHQWPVSHRRGRGEGRALVSSA
ncbi:hypothetical protein Poli38472_004399 [Pythium oligandrum]|uniref:P-type ATPase A domain-containing protein n=1 Tax=Pythium oligandrum TaxID=41045 RepID=A0A8K1CAM8_PYTOL|nr:hypothetical protein Poli38472_004399 [Pythium oligandrum]|eukprot:TMW59330.1 hypothetical protein Poli38472_004399 [Pythium oligandrum]